MLQFLLGFVTSYAVMATLYIYVKEKNSFERDSSFSNHPAGSNGYWVNR